MITISPIVSTAVVLVKVSVWDDRVRGRLVAQSGLSNQTIYIRVVTVATVVNCVQNMAIISSSVQFCLQFCFFNPHNSQLAG